MSITEVIIKESSDPYKLDIYNSAHVFRSLGVTFRFGVVSASRFPIILEAPLDIPAASGYVCFFGCAWSKNLTHCRNAFVKIQDRVLSIKDVPARHDEFDIHQLLSSESVGHEARCLACFEADPVKRVQLLERAYCIYEGVVMAFCHSSVNSVLQTISNGSTKAHLFQPFAEMETFTPDGRRLISHSFAGMAICSLMVGGTLAKYVSLASAAVCWEARRPLELACVLRMMPLLMSQADFVVNPGANFTALMSMIDSVRSVSGMFNTVTDKVLLPLMLRLGRRDLFDYELLCMLPERRAACESFAVAVEQRRVFVPASLKTVRTHVVNGKIIERVCAACSVWTGKHMRCSGCGMVYYCGKPCQLAHWKEHKSACVKK